MVEYIKFLISLCAVGCIVTASFEARLDNSTGNALFKAKSRKRLNSYHLESPEYLDKRFGEQGIFLREQHKDVRLKPHQSNANLSNDAEEGGKTVETSSKNKLSSLGFSDPEKNTTESNREDFTDSYYRHRRVKGVFSTDEMVKNHLQNNLKDLNNDKKVRTNFYVDINDKIHTHQTSEKIVDSSFIRQTTGSRKIYEEDNNREILFARKVISDEFKIKYKYETGYRSRAIEDNRRNEESVESHGIGLSYPRTDEVKPYIFLENEVDNNPLATLPPNVTGLCPEPGPENGLDPCTCTNNGGSLGGTINIDCPPEVSSQYILEDIIQRTTFFTTDVDRFTLISSEIGGVFSMDMFLPLTVRELLMNNDRFQSVDNHAFNASANFLSSISLANNDISYFHFGAVTPEEVPNLLYLDISGNDLEFLPQDAFVHPRLETVSIASNNIFTISQNCFSGLTKSQLIDVSNNHLSDLQSNTFAISGHSTASVLQIDVSNNSIRYIPPDAFGDLIDLTVDLRENELTSLDEAVFRPIIVNSNYFAYFQAEGNPIECNCSIFWIVSSLQIMECFDNFHCANIEKTLYQLTPEDMPECQFYSGIG